MAAVDLKVSSRRSVSVPAASMQQFEPHLLGSLRPRYRQIVRAIDGRRQSEIRQILASELAQGFGSAGRDGLAYEATLLVLRDYVASGYYPTVASGHLFLAPLFESTDLSDEQRRTAMTRLYRTSRDRALVERGQISWIRRAAAAASGAEYNAGAVLDVLRQGPPEVAVRRAVENATPLDTRGLWRIVRATWSMGPEASAPGREVAHLVEDRRVPGTPLGILQFRNVVPEIRARDEWLGISAVASDGSRSGGFSGRLSIFSARDARERVAATGDILSRLLAHVQLSGIAERQPVLADVPRLTDIIKSRQGRYRDERRQGAATAHDHLAIIKRAETAVDLLRGLHAVERLLIDERHPAEALVDEEDVRRDLDAGLGKIWHYHMGFVALELSVCGAAPPFGPARVGKLVAALAGSAEAVRGWGVERPLGEIASKVYSADVRSDVQNPGPLVILTSGLFPGHSAQYNRVSSGHRRWRKIGETTGWGAFHIGVDTVRTLSALNELLDGYVHISRRFGEGSGPRFRAVGRALAQLGLPDLRRHETRRPLYVLSLVDDPGAVLLGWEPHLPSRLPSSAEIAAQWWHRWFEPRADELVQACQTSTNLQEEIATLATLE